MILHSKTNLFACTEMIGLVLFGLASLTSIPPTDASVSVIQFYFWEVKPYIWIENGTIKGLLKEITDKMSFYCGHHMNASNRQSVINYTERISYDTFDMVINDVRKLNLTPTQMINTAIVPTLKHPDFQYPYKDSSYPERYKNIMFGPMKLFNTRGYVIIVPRSQTQLPTKIMYGLYNCRTLMIIMGSFAILMGSLMWLVERRSNDDFQSMFFHKGAAAGFWWANVTMTTVGYGDKVPRSCLGRCLGSIWMLFGVAFAALITAVVISSVLGAGDLEIYGKHVSALLDTAEMEIAKEYTDLVHGCLSYDDVLQQVRDGNVDAAIMNAEVASWMQDEIKGEGGHSPLNIVLEVTRPLPFSLFTYTEENAENMWNCLRQQATTFIENPHQKYRRHVKVEILHRTTFQEMFTESYIYIILIVCVSLVFVGGLSWDYYQFARNRKKTEQATDQSNTPSSLCAFVKTNNGFRDYDLEKGIDNKMASDVSAMY